MNTNDESQPESPSSPAFQLETPRPLSRSMIWKIQRHFFESRGTAAWGEGLVPSYITNNPFIANAYAQVVHGFVDDLVTARGNPRFGPLDLAAPIYVVELGAGSGRLAFHWLRSRAAAAREPDGPRLIYVLTDLAEHNIEFWELHPDLEPLVRAGLLDFARFDAEHPGPLELRHGGRALAPGANNNPVILIANYFFDSIPQDAFYWQSGTLYSSLLELRTAQPEPDLSDPGLFKRLTLTYHREPATFPYYQDPEWNALLESYRRELSDTALDFPNIALECLRFFRDLGQGRLLLLSADKGYHRAEDLRNRREPGYAVHGSFSMMVNYHALGRYFQNHGGSVLAPDYRYWGVDILTMLMGDHPTAYRQTRRAYRELIDERSPDDYINLTNALEPRLESLTFQQLIAHLRFSGWDTHIFQKAFPRLLALTGDLDDRERKELQAAIDHLLQNYYYIGEESDPIFNLGMLLHKLGEYQQALALFERSIELFGAAPSTLYNKAVCHYRLQQIDRALEVVQAALKLNPEMEQALKLREQIQNAEG